MPAVEESCEPNPDTVDAATADATVDAADATVDAADATVDAADATVDAADATVDPPVDAAATAAADAADSDPCAEIDEPTAANCPAELCIFTPEVAAVEARCDGGTACESMDQVACEDLAGLFIYCYSSLLWIQLV